MRTRGFTLIELMLAVAIIGILAAIAIPNFVSFQRRSKASEAKANLAAIRTAESSYFSEYGTHVSALPSPPSWAPGATGRQPHKWVDASAPDGFSILGWAPEGEVWFQYQVTSAGERFTAEARSDMDGDLSVNVWGYVKPDPAGSTLPGSFGCAAAGVYNSSTGTTDQIETVGPCAAGMGLNIF
jgi:type IV pilus assembly protein PilA